MTEGVKVMERGKRWNKRRKEGRNVKQMEKSHREQERERSLRLKLSNKGDHC